MSDVRLIDANALLEDLGEKYRETDPRDPEQFGYLKARIIVCNQPSVDAVPVVRCSACKEADRSVFLPEGCLFCNVWDSVTRSDGFCYCGKAGDV